VTGRRSLATVAALFALAAACTSEFERDLPDVGLTTPTESPAVTDAPAPTDAPAATAPTVATGASDAPGRIAILDGLGNLVTFHPDGSNVTVLADGMQGGAVVLQPTWSPDGERIAWVRLTQDEEGGTAVVTTEPDGGTQTETPTAVMPFYLYWDPTSSRVAFLGSSASGDIELGLAEIRDGGEATALDTGTPFYLSWNPGGDELLVHVGLDRLERLEIAGVATPVHERPGTFNAPVWTSDGRSLVYASQDGDRQRLVAHDVELDRTRALVRFDGAITFVVSPDGRRVAFQVAQGPDDVGPLSVLDRDTGTVEPVVDEIVPAFFWSPGGDRLLYALPEEVADRFWFRWGVWDGRSSFTTPRFYPTETFARDYLRFFEQYAQSMTLWAPDGSAFTYAGVNEAGDGGVWIQPAVDGAEPVLVTHGVFASWSPA
jgi:hypothetical protein